MREFVTTHHLQDDVSAYWSAWADEYNDHQRRRLLMPGELEAWQSVWRPGLPKPAAEVLDVGTGSGHAAFAVAGLGHRVTGIDIAEGMLALARERALASSESGLHPGMVPQFLHDDASDPAFPPASWDVIIARYALWTMPEPVSVLRRWTRLLRPGGRLVVVDSPWFPNGMLHTKAADAETPRSRDFRAAYAGSLDRLPLAEASTIGAFTKAVGQAGFVDIEVEPLQEIHALDVAHGVAAGHDVQRQFRISARIR